MRSITFIETYGAGGQEPRRKIKAIMPAGIGHIVLEIGDQRISLSPQSADRLGQWLRAAAAVDLIDGIS